MLHSLEDRVIMLVVICCVSGPVLSSLRASCVVSVNPRLLYEVGTTASTFYKVIWFVMCVE